MSRPRPLPTCPASAAPRLALCLSVCLSAASPAGASPQRETFSLMVRGGTLVDGTGAPPRRVDVAVRGDRIVAVGDALPTHAAERVLDARGLVLTPGFVDTHTHADDIAESPLAANFLRMGVTTIVSGNCGSSNLDVAAHLDELERLGTGPNYATLIGHGTVRAAVLGRAARAPARRELEVMRAHVAAAMRAGAVGMSTGLIYVPGVYAETDEIVALARVVAAHGGVYATHMRDEGNHVLEAIEEALAIGVQAEVPVHISHLKASGRRVWGRGKAIVARVRRARAAGRRVTGDQYAYTASSTSLDVLLPAAVRTSSRKELSRRLREDPAFADRMRRAVREHVAATGFEDLSYARIAQAPGNEDLNGKTLDQAARIRTGRADLDAQIQLVLRLFVDARGRRISMIYHKMSEADVETIMREPWVSVASDSGIRRPDTASRPHPRGCGDNPRVLSRYVRDRATLPLAAAVRKMTELPARIFGFEGRGRVEAGAYADLVVFDFERIRDRATWEAPLEPPEGIAWVVVNGVVVVDHGRLTGARPGRVLRGGRR